MMNGESILQLAQGALLCAAVLLFPAALAADGAPDTARIEQLTGLKGTLNQQEGVFKVTLPRNDLQVKVGGSRLVPDQGLTAWAAFTMQQNHAMVMGDIVLLESEVNPVMSVALENGLQVTALHNHFLWESPRVMFMHIGGMGEEAQLAGAVGRVFGKLKELIAAAPVAPVADVDPAKTSFDAARIGQVIGATGALNNGVYKIVIGRTAIMGEHEVGKEMGLNTWAAFAGSAQQALVDGDFAMLEGEVQGVLKALRNANINIVAIHNHMIGESPRYVFLHYWGVGPVEDLAKGLRTALDTQSGR